MILEIDKLLTFKVILESRGFGMDSVGLGCAQAGGHALHTGLSADSVGLSADGSRPQARRPAPHVDLEESLTGVAKCQCSLNGGFSGPPWRHLGRDGVTSFVPARGCAGKGAQPRAIEDALFRRRAHDLLRPGRWPCAGERLFFPVSGGKVTA